MKILIFGGTRYFGISMVKELIRQGHDITIATRQLTKDSFGDAVQRICVERTDPVSVTQALQGKKYDIVYDKIAYCSNDIKYVMDAIDCEKYIYMSSASIYESKKINTREDDFDGITKELVWCSRSDFPYDEIKRLAECALWQIYPNRNWTAVRYPFVIGKNDYTERLLFYVEHTMKSIPMNIDNLENQMGYIRSDEAGKFLAFLADKNFSGAVNGSAHGTISLNEIIHYVENKTNTKAIITAGGDDAPYNGEPEYSLNTVKAENLGFKFSNLNDWIFDLLDYYINKVNDTM